MNKNIINRRGSTITGFIMLVGLLFLISTPSRAAEIPVTSTADTVAVDGVITLREAIIAANTNQPSGDAPKGDPGLDTISFNIPGNAVHTILLTSPLPNITEPVFINGYSQPGASANTLAVGNDAVLLIELSGEGAGAGASGLAITAGNSTIRGLVINRFSVRGIALQTKGSNTIAGNFIGTNAGGTASYPAPNNAQGVYINSPDNVIGGINPADRNVISGNGTSSGGTGVIVDGAAVTGNKILGNYVGLSASGLVRVFNINSGITLNNTKMNIVGGSTAAERNVISGNQNGITLAGSSSDNQILGNYIGPKADGSSGAGNGAVGITFNGTASNNLIGGGQAGAGNVIAFNNGTGVAVVTKNINNAISGNAIFSNGNISNALGIDLFVGGLGVTPNDDNAGDADSGSNNLQNYPVITSVVSLGGTTTIQGTLDSGVSATFRIELFSNNACDGSGFGEGQNYLGATNSPTDAGGKGTFTFTVPTSSVAGGFFTSTATDAAGNTSEFSACTAGVVANPGTLQFGASSVIGSESSGTMSINVVRTNGSGGVVTVDYATSDKLAKAPADYAATSGTLTFQDGETIKPITIPIVDDNIPEGSESFILSLSNPTGGAVLGGSSAEFFIPDNEVPSITISDATVAEGDQGNAKLTFTVTLSNPVNGSVLVDYATGGGSATAGTDYQPINGVLTFGPYITVKQIDVLVAGDTFGEPDETVFLNLSSPQSGTIAKAKGTGTIVNDDAAAPAGTLAFSAASFSTNENVGQVIITVKRIGGSNGAVSVQYAPIAGGTATEVSDYTAPSGTLDWADGEVADKTFAIAVADDSLNEANETVSLVLSNPNGTQTSAPSTAVLTIIDNDPKPSLTIADVSRAEGNSGPSAFDFKVDLSAASGQTVTVDFTTTDGTANSGDYQLNLGILTFSPGETSKIVSVNVTGDSTIEPDETFSVNLSNPANATIAKGQGTGTIVNDDAAAPAGTLAFSAASYSANENGGQAVITVKRSGGSNGAVSVQYATIAGGSATEASDYTATSGTLDWADGDVADKTFTIAIADDSLNEADETVSLVLSNPNGTQTSAPSTAVLTVLDNDPKPSLTIADVSQAEGNSSPSTFDFKVDLSAASGQSVTVDFTTTDGTATAGDYQLNLGIITFSPGETSKIVSVNVNGDGANEPDETFSVNLSNPANATIARAQGIGTIVNDDGVAVPTIQFSQATYSGQEDLGWLTVTITRAGDTSAAASVDYETVDGSATQKADFEYAAGTLALAPGESSRTIKLLINEDAYIEGNETFSVKLSNPAGAVLGQQSLAGVTIDDDLPESATNPIDEPQSFVYTHYHDFLNREPDPAGLAFWTNQIASCGSDVKCIEEKRVNVSASFFLSIEFQETGYLRYLIEKESFGSLPKYAEFMRDLQEVGRDVVVNSPGWEPKLRDNQQQFAEKWVNRPAFKAVYDSMSNVEYVNALYANAGVLPTQAERDSLVNELDTASESRAGILLDVAKNVAFREKENNSAFVLMQYFGYLRRDPAAAPDSDLSGYNFWLSKLNQFGGNYIDAEMIKAFITSIEYRQRFAQ